MKWRVMNGRIPHVFDERQCWFGDVVEQVLYLKYLTITANKHQVYIQYVQTESVFSWSDVSIKQSTASDQLTNAFQCLSPAFKVSASPNTTKPHFARVWKMRVTIVCEDEREEITEYISTYDMQGQSIKAN